MLVCALCYQKPIPKHRYQLYQAWVCDFRLSQHRRSAVCPRICDFLAGSPLGEIFENSCMGTLVAWLVPDQRGYGAEGIYDHWASSTP